MSRKLPILTLILLVSFCTPAIAIAPFGPPAANLGKGKTSVGISYTYSKMSLDFDNGSSPGGGPAFTLDGIKSHGVFVDISRGFNDKWEAFIRLGAGSTRNTNNVAGTSVHIHDPDKGYALGFGTKWTFCQPRENLKLGGIFQMLWTEVESEGKINGNRWDTNTSMVEVQLAVGPHYQFRENISLYGGAFVNYVDGEFFARRKNVANKISYDIDSGELFGGFIGTSLDINASTALNVEWQHTSALDLFGLSLVIEFD
ncbi:MAG: hypothetical protein K8R02_01410 [Anaerohalosphaeraceae bacterium]|nr:hypothetical protein [Anaerohalosphaeraceae bacterium]